MVRSWGHASLEVSMTAQRGSMQSFDKVGAPLSGWAPAAALGPYRLKRLIGSGGLGAVYEAVDPAGAAVAIKTLGHCTESMGDDALSLSREVALKCQLDHPNIAKVVDAGVSDGMAYLVMEFVEGESLACHTKPTRLLPIAEALKYGADVAFALAHAHGRGVIHRDVKPDNILVDRRVRTAKLTDFGIAMLGDAFRTQTGVIPGTPAYMSPEQLCGGVIDTRTDLYALGVVLFETLSGCRPHEAATLGALLREVASRDAPALKRIRRGIPEPVSSLVTGLLARTPADRPAHAASVAAILSDLAQREQLASVGPKSRG